MGRKTKSIKQIDLPIMIKVKRTCTRCHRNPVYLDIRSMDLCPDCIWKIVQEDQ